MEKESNNRTQESLLIDIAEVQRCYIPLSKRKIRNLVQTYIRTIKIYGKWLIRSRKQGNAAGRGISPVLAFDAIHFVTYICTMC